MDAIRSWWEVPCIAHFCHIFAKPFKLPEFEIEELEDTLLLDAVEEDPTPSLLVKLYCSLLNGIVDKEVAEENWEFFLKMHLQWRTDYLNEKFNPHDGKNYKELDTRTKVEILHRICHWRMELDDVGDLLRGYDGSLLRVEPLGTDEDGNVYWYFYGTRLYAEQGKKKKKNPSSEGTPNKGKGSRNRGRSKEAGKNGRKKNNKEEQQKEDNSPAEMEESGWRIVCSTSEEWEELIEKLRESKKTETKRLCNYLNDELLPEILYLLQQKEKIFKKKLLAEMPRRTSDRIAQKALKEEEERLDALQREIQREEQRKQEEEERIQMEQEAEKKHQEKLEEVIRKRKAKEEKQQEQRQKEEQNWHLALSGELSGPRKAAIGAVQGVVQTHTIIEEKDEDLYTDMYKVMAALRKIEDSWVFEEPVTEDIAPGYFEIIDKPMDFQTVEKNIESGKYLTREQFAADIELIFENCKEYNGEESEYFDLANEMLDLFQKQMKQIHQDSLLDEEEEGANIGRKKKKSPSPELTSESSEESSDEDEGVDENEEEDFDRKKKKKKSGNRPLEEEAFLVRPQMVNPNNPGMFRPHPQMYPPPHMMHPHMRPPPHVLQEMMGYPPHPYYGGPPPTRHPYPGGSHPPPPPPHHPMHMRPPPQHHPREPFMPPESYRYPYPPMNSMPPPPYGHPMMSPEQQQQMMQRRMMGHPPYPMNGGPPPPQASMMPPQRFPGASQPHEPPMAMAKDSSDRGERVSSPRVSSTVKTPPTSGDEKGDDEKKVTKEQEEGNNNPSSDVLSKEENIEKVTPTTNNDSNHFKQQQQQQQKDEQPANSNKSGSGMTNGPSANPPLPPPPPPPSQQQPHPSQSQHPHSVRPQMQQHMRGGYPPTQAMMDERQRYYHAMMMRRQQYMMAQGYPPPSHEDPYYNWSGGQRPPPPYGPAQHPQYSQQQRQAAMMERQRYMEYQMRMRAAAASAARPGSVPQPQGSAATTTTATAASSSEGAKKDKKESTGDKNTTGESGVTPGVKDNREDDIPDYHDSLTQYARGLATGEEEKKEEEKGSEGDKPADTEAKPDQENPASPLPKQSIKENLEARHPNRNVQNGPPMHGRPNWPHPGGHPGQMMPNGYDGSMMPHPHYGNMMPSQHMYSPGPHLPPHPNMSYPPYPDPSGHYNMMPTEMDQWRYMEMQRQWMARHHHDRMSPQGGVAKGLKRPLPRTPIPLDKQVPNSMEQTEPPPAKQPKLSEETEDEDDKDLAGEEESSSPVKETTSLET